MDNDSQVVFWRIAAGGSEHRMGCHQPDGIGGEWPGVVELVLFRQHGHHTGNISRSRFEPEWTRAHREREREHAQLVDTGVSGGTTYYYWIKNTVSGVAENSNAASATPSGGGSGSGGGSITGSSCNTSGAQTTVNATIRVTSGTYDGGCQRFNAGSALGDGSQSEGQQPVFRVENGATLRNVVLGNNGADGIHTYNGAVLDNIYWMNVGEDAMTIKSSGTTTVRNIEGYDADDKFFQVNAASTLNVSNCIIHRAGKVLRQNGGTTFQINVTVDRCDINDMSEGVFRTDSSSSTARLTNSRLHDAGSVCIGSWSSCTQSGNTNY